MFNSFPKNGRDDRLNRLSTTYKLKDTTQDILIEKCNQN